jgi:hypothetical protein
MIWDQRAYDELKRLFDESYKARWDEKATKDRCSFEEGRNMAYGHALALLQGETLR